jgi:catechol 2,3-dioxygenase-like lactoylglutathione lyase family enzyme
MKGYIICGIQQIGIGVTDLSDAWKWYIDLFGMDCRIFEEDAEAKLMLPYTGNQPRRRHAVLAMNLQGGGGFEVWQHKGREPLLKKDEIRLGDLGIIGCKMKTRNISEAYSFFKKKNSLLLNEPSENPSGVKSFFIKDPFGNLFQITEAHDWFMNENKMTGGTCGALIGVSDIEKSKALYSDILGYDEVVYDTTGIFPDLAGLPGGHNEIRRVLLKSSKQFTGPFSKVLGQSMMELICSPDKTGKRIYENRFWGDPGFIHLCFDIRGMDELKAFCSKQGFGFTVDSKQSHDGNSFDMGEAAGHFSYIEDPDGTLIEFVETHKLPVLRKVGWYLDLKKRGPKPLPDWIIKMLRFSRVRI